MGTADIIILCVLMLMLGAMLGASMVAVLVFTAVREKKSPAPQRQKEDPCETCLRWDECMGIDKDCPRRNDNE